MYGLRIYNGEEYLFTIKDLIENPWHFHVQGNSILTVRVEPDYENETFVEISGALYSKDAEMHRILRDMGSAEESSFFKTAYTRIQFRQNDNFYLYGMVYVGPIVAWPNIRQYFRYGRRTQIDGIGIEIKPSFQKRYKANLELARSIARCSVQAEQNKTLRILRYAHL